VTEMNVGRGWIEPLLDPQGPPFARAESQALEQRTLGEDLLRAKGEPLDLSFRCLHGPRTRPRFTSRPGRPILGLGQGRGKSSGSTGLQRIELAMPACALPETA